MSQATPHFTKVSGRSIHYVLLHKQWLKEDRPLLVFLHEGLGSIKQWKDFPNLLADRVHCPALLYDRYGYGLSEEREGAIYTRFLHDEAIVSLPELFANLGLKDVPKILVGHSDGGTIALVHAGAHPENILVVISEAAHVLVEEATINGILQVKSDIAKGKMLELLKRYHGERTERLATGWVGNWLSDESMEWNVEEYLPGIKCPVLAIQGDLDHFGSYAQLESIEQKAGGPAEILYIPGCGHIPHKQAKAEVLEAMTEFITNIVIINHK